MQVIIPEKVLEEGNKYFKSGIYKKVEIASLLTGKESKDHTIIESFNTPERILTIKEPELIKCLDQVAKQFENEYDVITSPHKCCITKGYRSRLEDKTIIGNAHLHFTDDELRPSIEDLDTCNSYKDVTNVIQIIYNQYLESKVFCFNRFAIQAIFDQEVLLEDFIEKWTKKLIVEPLILSS